MHIYTRGTVSDDPSRSSGGGSAGLEAALEIFAGAETVILVPVAGTVLAAEDSGVEHQDVEQLCEGEYYHERLYHSESPTSMPSYVYLLACQPIYTIIK